MNKLNLVYLFIGIIIGLIFIFVFFGTKIKSKSMPKIKVNIGNFVRNSHIYLFNYHIHHWFLNFIILIIIQLIQNYKNIVYFDIVKGFNIALIFHGLLYSDCFNFID